MMAHTTDFIFDNGEFFAAKTDSGKIRVGMNGGRCFDISESSPLFSVASSKLDAELTEELFDSCMDLYA